MHLILIITCVKFIPRWSFSQHAFCMLGAVPRCWWWNLQKILILLLFDFFLNNHAKMLGELHSSGSSSCCKPYMSLVQKDYSCDLCWETLGRCTAGKGQIPCYWSMFLITPFSKTSTYQMQRGWGLGYSLTLSVILVTTDCSFYLLYLLYSPW
jgi:hypothetical protein